MRIDTERLFMRPFEESDLEDFYQLAKDPEVMRFSVAGPHSRELTAERLTFSIAMQVEYGYSPLPVFRKEDDAFMGYCGFLRHKIEGVMELEITYRFLPAYWGKGYATEAAIACKEYAFSKLGLTRLVSVIEPENIRSINVALRNGMTKEKSSIFHGLSVDVYSIEDKR